MQNIISARLSGDEYSLGFIFGDIFLTKEPKAFNLLERKIQVTVNSSTVCTFNPNELQFLRFAKFLCKYDLEEDDRIDGEILNHITPFAYGDDVFESGAYSIKLIQLYYDTYQNGENVVIWHDGFEVFKKRKIRLFDPEPVLLAQFPFTDAFLEEVQKWVKMRISSLNS